MPVAEGAQETSLQLVGPNFICVGSTDPPAAQDPIFRLADERVRQRNLVKQSAVHGPQEVIGRRPVHFVKILDGLVVPTNHGFIGTQFLEVPVIAEVGGKTFVDAAQVTTAIGAVVARQGQSTVNFGQGTAVTRFVGKKFIGGKAVLRGTIEVFGAVYQKDCTNYEDAKF